MGVVVTVAAKCSASVSLGGDGSEFKNIHARAIFGIFEWIQLLSSRKQDLHDHGLQYLHLMCSCVRF
jgi:hypothetical protein